MKTFILKALLILSLIFVFMPVSQAALIDYTKEGYNFNKIKTVFLLEPDTIDLNIEPDDQIKLDYIFINQAEKLKGIKVITREELEAIIMTKHLKTIEELRKELGNEGYASIFFATITQEADILINIDLNVF